MGGPEIPGPALDEHNFLQEILNFHNNEVDHGMNINAAIQRARTVPLLRGHRPRPEIVAADIPVARTLNAPLAHFPQGIGHIRAPEAGGQTTPIDLTGDEDVQPNRTAQLRPAQGNHRGNIIRVDPNGRRTVRLTDLTR